MTADHHDRQHRPVDDRAGDARPDPIDEEAAEIDARSPDAPEQIEQLKDDAEDLGRDVEA